MSIQFDQINPASTGHSSIVTMTLHAGTASFRVLQSSGDAIKLMACESVPQGDAVFETVVDGRLHRRLVRVLASSPRPNWIDIADR